MNALAPSARGASIATPLVDRYREALLASRARFGSATERSRVALLPVETLRAIIAEAKAALPHVAPPALIDLGQAGKLTKLLLGGWPTLKPHDPETFTTIVMATFQEFDWQTGWDAVRRMHRMLSYPPNPKEVLDACVACRFRPDARYIAAIANAEAQLAEHRERAHSAAVARDHATVAPKFAALLADLRTNPALRTRRDGETGPAPQLSPAEIAEREARAAAFEEAAKQTGAPDPGAREEV